MVEVLLVEDNKTDAELALHSLKRDNLANSVRVASDGVEALDCVFGADGTGFSGVGSCVSS